MLPQTHGKHIQYSQWKISVVARRICTPSHTPHFSPFCCLSPCTLQCCLWLLWSSNIAATYQLVQRHCIFCSTKSNVNKNLTLLQHIINPFNVTMIWHPQVIAILSLLARNGYGQGSGWEMQACDPYPKVLLGGHIVMHGKIIQCQW